MNLFGRPYNWAASPNENFNTECLAYLLDLSLDRQPSLATAVLTSFSSGRVSWSQSDATSITISTQSREAGDQPDVWILWPGDPHHRDMFAACVRGARRRPNPHVLAPGMVFFVHMILLNSETGLSMCLGDFIVTADDAEPVTDAPRRLVRELSRRAHAKGQRP